MRLLNNLRAIYERTGDQERLLSVLARMQVLSPDDEIRSRILQVTARTVPRNGSGSTLN
jgi:hypothetical protein